jgi:bifunctional UDP-N-acetylglucosamine pyrophosphorylase/glucosamine-1-phosphate N-acetyltransferase
MLQGRTSVGAGAHVGPDVRLVDCLVGDGAWVEHAVGRDAEIGRGAVVGPYAVLAPGAHVGPDQRAGPFYNGSAPGDEGA